MRIRTIDPEHSVSFALADEVRKAVLRPWKLPLLPLNVPRRLTRRTSNATSQAPTLVDAVIVIDAETIRDVDLKQILAGMKKSFDSVALALIGTIDGVVADLQLPRKGDKANAEPWNALVCSSVLHLVRTLSPRHVIYIGKFPHGGIRRIGNRINPRGQISWLAIRSDEATLAKYSPNFCSVTSFSQAKYPESMTIWVDNSLPISWSIPSRTDDISAADILVVPSGELPSLESWLSEGRVVVMVEDGPMPSVLDFVNLAGLRLVHLNASDGRLEEHIHSVFTHFKGQGHGPALRSAIRCFKELTLVQS